MRALLIAALSLSAASASASDFTDFPTIDRSDDDFLFVSSSEDYGAGVFSNYETWVASAWITDPGPYYKLAFNSKNWRDFADKASKMEVDEWTKKHGPRDWLSPKINWDQVYKEFIDYQQWLKKQGQSVEPL